jgi:GDP-4-dehydro-6-deoxy-D-mannose reductase
MLDREKVEEVVLNINPNWVVHLAALSSPKQSVDKPSETIANNVSIQVHLFEALMKLEQLPQKVLVIGSAEEYGLVKPEDCPISELVPLRPTNPYAVSKIAQDYLGLQYFLANSLPVVRLRPFNHTGERRPPIFVLPAFAKQLAEIEAGLKEPVMRVGNLDAIRDFTDVKDMVKAYVLALEKGKPGEVYNLGSGREVVIKDLLSMLLSKSEINVDVEIDPVLSKASDVPKLVADATKFRQLTGWQPETPILVTIERVLNYWRAQVTSH